MYRIDNSSAISALPITAPPGTAGFFTDGNPAAALPATVVDAWWLNQLQEEILTVIDEAGFQPNKASHRQLYDSIRAIALSTNPDLSGHLPLTGGTLAGPGNLTVSGALSAIGNITGNATANIVGNVSAGSLNVAGAATVNGATTLNSTLAVGGNISGGGAAYFVGAVVSSSAVGVTEPPGHGLGFWEENNTMTFGSTDLYGAPLAGFFELWGSATAYPGDLILRFGRAWKPGGGEWMAISDARAKKDIADYPAGLKQVRALRPVTYRYNGLARQPDNDRIYHGLIAQDVATVMPEMVMARRMRLSPDDPTDSDVLTTDRTPLIFAVVNAVKELAGRVEALEAERRHSDG
jgi:hypothetical protein